ncbi:nitrogenase iron protein NifH [uncultured Fusobacterium sp.]|uniref:nitrogenase iron protein NifH n=1 Tax=uncultured Fusobacterium sp. TaxID=159267 RepID=UPI0027DD3D61|nr:nitrogenase iron protein NifH [uncultured Fusobacterium sp.]
MWLSSKIESSINWRVFLFKKNGGKMKKIAIYGKGGIGKTTTVSNLAAAFSVRGYRVLQIGCDPKSDSTKNILGEKKIKTVLDTIREKGNDILIEDILFTGFNNIKCIEAGGPKPGVGCAGRGIIAAFDKIKELNILENFKPEIVLFDVLGDVVCGGFTMPLREGYADEVYIVTSGEMMSLYAASNIAEAMKNLSNRGYAKLKGLILNRKNIENEEEIVKKAAKEIGIEIIMDIPRSSEIQIAENIGKTVIELNKNSKISGYYLKLSEKIYQGEKL